MQITSKVATKVATPIKDVLADAGALIDIGLQHGKVAMQNLIKVVEQQPELISAGDVAELRLPPKYFDSFEKLSNEISKQVTKDVAENSAKSNTSQILQELEKLNDNKIRHIIEGSATSNHKWEKLVPDKNWNDIKKIIADVMETGITRPYGSAQAIVKTIKGEVVEVSYVEINKIKKISNAWIK